LLKHNLIANLAGSGWSALMGLAFVPFYIKLMGAESYGIIGVFTSLIGILAVLDMGLVQIMNREMARLTVTPDHKNDLIDTARTLELIYWMIALVIVLIIFYLANFIAFSWLKPEHLTRQSVLHAISIMALVIGLRWPQAIYIGALNGLQRQVLVNAVLIIFSTLQSVGALLVLWFIEPTIQVFFIWQALVSLLNVVVLRFFLWRSFSSDYKGVFSQTVIKNIWRFAAGMTGVSFAATLLTQIDKLLLSKMLTLAEFGYYTFAVTVASVVFRIIGPVFTAYYPKLTEIVSKNDQFRLAGTYHQGCQLMAVAILPITFVIAFFSEEILGLWTGNSEIVANSSMLISLLIVGNALNGLMHIPYALQLAYGWTRLSFYQNVIAVIVLVPAIYFATMRWGAVGAAAIWIVLNTGYLLISAQVMYRHLLVGEKLNWYINDIGKILISIIVIVLTSKILLKIDYGYITNILILICIFGLSSASAILSAESIRRQLPINSLLGRSK